MKSAVGYLIAGAVLVALGVGVAIQNPDLLGVAAGLLILALGAFVGAYPWLARWTLGAPQTPPEGSDRGLCLGDGAGSATPSEVVVLAAQFFATRTVVGNSQGLDGRSKLSDRTLLEAALSAALLACEEAGQVEFVVPPASGASIEGHDGSLRVRSLEPAAWKAPTAESRLSFEGEEEVWRVFHRFLACNSPDPWSRGVEKLKAMLVLRGLATVRDRRGIRVYDFSDEDAAALGRGLAAAVWSRLEACREKRPELYAGLRRQLTRAVEERMGEADPAHTDFWEAPAQADVWYDEAKVDRDAIDGLVVQGDLRRISWPLAIVSAVAPWAALVTAASAGGTVFWVASGSVAAATVGYGSWEWARHRSPSPSPATFRPVQAPLWLRRLAADFRLGSVRSATRVLSGIRWLITQGGLGARAKWGLIAVPVVALVPTSLYLAREDTATIIYVLAAVAGVSFFFLKLRAGRAISEAATQSAPSSSEEMGKAEAHPTVPGWGDRALPFRVDVVRPGNFPEVTSESLGAVDAIEKRGPAVRRMYRERVAALAVASSAVLATSGSTDLAIASLVVLAVTLALLAHDAKKRWTASTESSHSDGPLGQFRRAYDAVRFAVMVVRYMRGGAAGEAVAWQREVVPIRPRAVPLIGWVWLVIDVGVALSTAGFTRLAAITIPVLYLVWIVRSKAALNKRYPLHSPLRLTALRVFGSPSIGRFLDLTDRWQWLGPIQRLDGPNTVGSSSADVVRYLSGRVGDAVVKSEDELEGVVTSFDNGADKQLRYRVQSMQCNDATWKVALSRLLDDANVVVMDLSGFAEENRGCVYELGQLLDRLPTRRCVLLVDDQTDQICLKDVLREAWDSRSATSPNAGDAADPIRLYHLGEDVERRPSEDVYEWIDRNKTQLDERWLVGFLRDSAVSGTPSEPLSRKWA